MCGIAGIINFNEVQVNQDDIRLMMRNMKHRGPDDDGIFVDGNIGLGFVRLSILDLSLAGHQPMHSHNNRYVIVFNGEIYNYIEIREGLKEEFEFKTGTDTEVILASYQKWGEECLDKFNGMFAFVIYDKETKRVFAARDRFGIKPFYYYVDNDRLIFASEIKSILPFVARVPNMQIIYDYLMFNRTDHKTETFFKGIKKMQHGSYFYVSHGQMKFTRWYELAKRVSSESVLGPKEYRDLLKDSVKLRLRADVPVGVSLSGGIDSSSITAMLSKDFKLKKLNTFSAVFGLDEPTDESDFINEFQSTIKNMHFTSPNAETFFHDFESFIVAHSEPSPDLGPYIQYKVMELAAEKVKVTLDGQGADEQLGGYHNFFSIYYLELIRRFKFLKLVKEYWSYYRKHQSYDVLKYFIYYLLPLRLQKRLSLNVNPSINVNVFAEYRNDFSVNKMLYKPKDLKDSFVQHFEYKLEHLLRWEDLNSMNFSIEARVPFLDHRLVEATLSSPSEMKIRDGETKYILREAMLDILPSKIAKRLDKKGFSNPRADWFRTPAFEKYIKDLISSETFVYRGIFDSKKALSQYEAHLSGVVDNSQEIWKWLNTEIWFRKFID